MMTGTAMATAAAAAVMMNWRTAEEGSSLVSIIKPMASSILVLLMRSLEAFLYRRRKIARYRMKNTAWAP